MFQMITSSQVSSVYCKNQWVLLCWREFGKPGLLSADFGGFARQSLLALWPASGSFWELWLRYFCGSVKGIFTIGCYIQLIQKTKNTAWDPGIFDGISLWPGFPFWHIKITLLHQEKTPGQKSKQGRQLPPLRQQSGVRFSILCSPALSTLYIFKCHGYLRQVTCLPND